jgi:hypothetical protein
MISLKEIKFVSVKIYLETERFYTVVEKYERKIYICPDAKRITL